MIFRVLAFLLVIAACSPAATVQTQVECWDWSQGFLLIHHVSGTYSANCNSTSEYHGMFGPETESASIIPGSSASTFSQGVQYNAGFATATFSAQYIFTITGGDVVTVPIPFPALGAPGSGAWVTGCLSASGFGVADPANNNQLTAAASATLGPWLVGGLGYSTCTGPERSHPYLLNVPYPMQLTLSASTYEDGHMQIPMSATAAFSGFQFFDNNGNSINVTYTLTLAEQLPPLPLPEPGSLAMMSGAAILWSIFRLRHGFRRGK
jgi:hypothetical protein